MITSKFFDKGKITFVIDQAWGSSAKGMVSANLAKNYDSNTPLFAITTNSPNASHTVIEGDKKIVFEVLPSASFYHENLSCVIIGTGAVIDVNALFNEIIKTGIPKHKIKIDANATVVQNIDKGYESGTINFEGEILEEKSDGTIKTGTTASGAGAARARKILRKSNRLLAKDVDILGEFITDTKRLIIDLLNFGQTALFEVAQGFPLSVSYDFYPNTTSRNVTVAAALDDIFVPVTYAGNVILNCRTFPIRIHSKKYASVGTQIVDSVDIERYIDDTTIVAEMIMQQESKYPSPKYNVQLEDSAIVIYITDGSFLTWDEVKNDSIAYKTIESYSGDCYKDQIELDWDTITEVSGSEKPIFEITSYTKLPRRVFTFSKQNLYDAILFNQTQGKTFLSVTFANYVSANLYKSKTPMMNKKFAEWVASNITPVIMEFKDKYDKNVELSIIQTGEETDDLVIL